MELTLWMKVLAVVTAALIGLASRFIMKQKPDNTIEQMAEKVIKDETGYTIDLSPDADGEDNGSK